MGPVAIKHYPNTTNFKGGGHLELHIRIFFVFVSKFLVYVSKAYCSPILITPIRCSSYYLKAGHKVKHLKNMKIFLCIMFSAPDDGYWQGGKYKFHVEVPEEYNIVVCRDIDTLFNKLITDLLKTLIVCRKNASFKIFVVILSQGKTQVFFHTVCSKK